VSATVPAGAAFAAGAGQISGTVTDAASNTPISGVCVDAGYGGLLHATTDAAGHYEFDNLDDHSYTVEFSDCSGNDYLLQYYDNVSTAGAAARVPVVVPAAVVAAR